MSDLISRQMVLRCIKESRDDIDWGQSEDGDAFLHYTGALYRTIASEECLPSAEPLTDAEQRIFLKAISLEEEVCRKVAQICGEEDEEYGISRVHVCHEIVRKVKGALWT